MHSCESELPERDTQFNRLTARTNRTGFESAIGYSVMTITVFRILYIACILLRYNILVLPTTFP